MIIGQSTTVRTRGRIDFVGIVGASVAMHLQLPHRARQKGPSETQLIEGLCSQALDEVTMLNQIQEEAYLSKGVRSIAVTTVRLRGANDAIADIIRHTLQLKLFVCEGHLAYFWESGFAMILQSESSHTVQY